MLGVQDYKTACPILQLPAKSRCHPETHLGFDYFSRAAHRTQRNVLLTVPVYYERI